MRMIDFESTTDYQQRVMSITCPVCFVQKGEMCNLLAGVNMKRADFHTARKSQALSEKEHGNQPESVRGDSGVQTGSDGLLTGSEPVNQDGIGTEPVSDPTLPTVETVPGISPGTAGGVEGDYVTDSGNVGHPEDDLVGDVSGGEESPSHPGEPQDQQQGPDSGS